MKNYYSIPNKYNRFLIVMLSIAPFLAFLTYDFLNIDLKRVIQLLSYIGVILVLIFKHKDRLIVFPRYLLYYLLFILYEFFSTFVLLDNDFDIKYLFSNRLIGAFNLLLIIENLSINRVFYKKIFRISKFILVIAFVVILIQQTMSVNFFLRTEFIEKEAGGSGTKDRLYSIYSWFGSYLAIGFGFTPIFMIVVEDLLKRKKKVIVWVLLGLLFAVLTKARWIMLNTAMVFFLLIIYSNNKMKTLVKFVLFIPIIAIMAYFILNTIGIDAKGILNDRILENDKGKDLSKKSAGTRLLAFEAFNRFFWDQPVLGKGSIKYGMAGTGKQDYKLRKFLAGRSAQIHVGYLSLFYMFGLVGGILFLSFLYNLLRKMYWDAKKTTFWGPFFGMLCFVVANLTLVSFSLFETGLIFILVANKYYIQQLSITKLRDAF